MSAAHLLPFDSTMEDITSGISELTITPDRRCLLLREYISKHPDASQTLNVFWHANILDVTKHLYRNVTAPAMAVAVNDIIPSDLITKIFGGPLAVENATNVQMLKREFHDVAEFVVTLFPYTPPPKKTEENMDAETLSELANLLANAFRQRCRGDAPKRLHGAIKVFDCMYDPALHFGKVVAITAASCAGKTFTACYVSNYEVSIYICFRAMYQVDQPVTPDQGWPPQDTPACRFFYAHKDAMWKVRPLSSVCGKITNTIFHQQGEELAAAFLGALFTVMAEKLEGCEELSQFNAHWVIDKAADLEHSTRFKTFLEVEAKANKILESTSWLELRKVHHFDAAGPNAEIVDFPAWHKSLFEACVRRPLETLDATRIKHRLGKYIIISLDECTQLSHDYQRGAGHVPQNCISLIAIQRLIKTCEQFPCWFLLLDTNSSVSALHPPPGRDAPSSRLDGILAPLPVWPYLDFDIMVDEAFRAGGPTPDAALGLTHLRCYGRPYWSSTPLSRLLRSAIRKLLCETQFHPGKDADQVFAVLSQRLLIPLSNNQDAHKIAATGVRSHMRTLIGVIDRTILVTDAPSEPMLAIAAAEVMTRPGNHSEYQQTMASLVQALILNDVVDRGSLGELLARTYIIIARDAALNGQSFVDTSSPLNPGKVRPVPLKSFLTSLLPGIAFGKVTFKTVGTGKKKQQQKDTTINPVHGVAMLDEVQDYVLNFTHFVQVSQNISFVDKEFLYRTWYDSH
ncbi:hypothetical protein HGRIS_003519 [Hohenbuehelia grisea]|uniref:Uncharacterized protein n=1 Tax=Hohenbuehelia grisea TaxID=104357 RepID=A0ABR3JGH6_9AGAR